MLSAFLKSTKWQTQTLTLFVELLHLRTSVVNHQCSYFLLFCSTYFSSYKPYAHILSFEISTFSTVCVPQDPSPYTLEKGHAGPSQPVMLSSSLNLGSPSACAPALLRTVPFFTCSAPTSILCLLPSPEGASSAKWGETGMPPQKTFSDSSSSSRPGVPKKGG